MAGSTLLSLWARKAGSSLKDGACAGGKPQETKETGIESVAGATETAADEPKIEVPAEQRDAGSTGSDCVPVLEPSSPSGDRYASPAADTASEGKDCKRKSGGRFGNSAAKVTLSPSTKPLTTSTEPANLGEPKDSADNDGIGDVSPPKAQNLDQRWVNDLAGAPEPTPLQPNPEPVADADAGKMLVELKKEAAMVKEWMQQPQALDRPVSIKTLNFQKSDVAFMIHGSSAPLSSLTKELCGSLSAPNETAVRNCILSIATRTSFVPSDGRADHLDALEDVTEGLVWRWTVRDSKVLPKALRNAAAKITKQLQGWKERLALVEKVIELLQSKTGSAQSRSSKLSKLVIKLEKLRAAQIGDVPSLSRLDGSEAAPGDNGAQHQPAMEASDAVAEPEVIEDAKMAESAVAAAVEAKETISVDNQTCTNGIVKGESEREECLRAEKEKEKERLRNEKEAEKERLRLEKDAEKQRLKAEKDRLKEEKDAEKSRQREERERAKQEKEAHDAELKKKRQAQQELERQNKKAAKAGFSDTKQLQSAQGLLGSFVCKSATQNRSMNACMDAQNPPEVPSQFLHYYQVFTPCPPEQRLLSGTELSAEGIEELDRQLAEPLTQGTVHSIFDEMLQRWRVQCSARRKVFGLPPNWARKHGARAPALPRGADPSSIITYRRKLIHKDSSAPRPPYYGSWSRGSKSVRPRNPFARDDGMEYDVESEWDWEEPDPNEDPGESLSDADGPEEGEDGSDSDGDGGFCVPDGYLSADEGGCVDIMDVDDADEVMADAASLPNDHAGFVPSLLELRKLQVVLEKAKKLERSVILDRFSYGSDMPWQLAALKMRAMPGSQPITVPSASNEEEEEQEEKLDAASKAPGRMQTLFDETLTKQLLEFLLGNPQLKVNKVTDAFVELCKDKGLTKAAVKRKILEVASHQGNKSGWLIPKELQDQYEIATQPPTQPPTAVAPSKQTKKPTPQLQTGGMKANALVKFIKRAKDEQQPETDAEQPSTQRPMPPPENTPSRSPACVAKGLASDLRSPAPPTPDTAHHGEVIEDSPGASFWKDVRRWLVKGSIEKSVSKGLAFASADCVLDSIASMPLDIFPAILKTVANDKEAGVQCHAAQAACNIAAAVLQSADAGPTSSGIDTEVKAWPPVITLDAVLREPLIAHSCEKALESGNGDLQYHAVKLLAILTQPMKNADRNGKQGKGASLLRLQLFHNKILLDSLSSVMLAGAQEGNKICAYAAMVLSEIFTEAVKNKNCSQEETIDLSRLVDAGSAAIRSVACITNPEHLSHAKHIMSLVASMVSHGDMRSLLLGPPPLRLREDSAVESLLHAISIALESERPVLAESAIKVLEELTSIDGDITNLLRAKAEGKDNVFGDCNINTVWVRLNQIATKDMDSSSSLPGQAKQVLQRLIN